MTTSPPFEDEMLIEAGVEILYHTSFIKPVLEGNTVTGGIFTSKSGLEKINCKVMIDATGDGDVAMRSNRNNYRQSRRQLFPGRYAYKSAGCYTCIQACR